MVKADRLAAMAFLVASAFAGCVVDEAREETGQRGPDLRNEVRAYLDNLTPPRIERGVGVAWWEDFVTTYSHREWGTPQNAAAAIYLANELRGAGFETEQFALKGKARAPGAYADLPYDVDYQIVRGLHPGTGNASHRLVLIAHYDVVTETVQGAYDDGSGVAIQMQICKLLAQLQTNHTIECVFFDGEEKGWKASLAYTRDYAAGGKEWIWDMAFGFDMTGLNWPGYADWKLYAMLGTNEATSAAKEPNLNFLGIVLYDFLGKRLGVTRDGVELLDEYRRTSDELKFLEIGIPIVRFVGGERADDYPMYHRPGDTTTYVYTFACGCTDLAEGKARFGLGFEMVVQVAYYTILAYDRFDPTELRF